MPATIKLDSPGFYLAFLVIVAFGVYLRLDQFTLQVLLDDEWHVVHQLLAKSPGELVRSFGRSDFSIPLALLYWVQMKTIGLSELGMRWPMMLAGIAILLLFPLYLRKHFDDSAILVFTFLLAISPRLVLYSRVARPYALTLLLSILALGLLHRYVESEKPPVRTGIFYVLCAVTSCWLHSISLPLVTAPFLLYGVPALINRDYDRLKRLFWLGLPTLVVLLIVILPPMLANQAYLPARFGVDTPEFQTFTGLLFNWAGTGSINVAIVSIVFAIIGFAAMWRGFPLYNSMVLGLVLTLAAVLLAKPAWIQNSSTLTRYLLPALPFFLLSVSLGISRFSDVLARNWSEAGRYSSWLIILAVFSLMIYHSPLLETLKTPNSNSLHSAYQFDYRDQSNRVVQYQKDFPVSPLWKRLAEHPRDSIKIAVAPFSFETTHWDAARWEQISHQRVMPGYIHGFCVRSWWGEVPNGSGFRFKNVGYLSDHSDLIDRGFDLVVYQKPNEVMTNQGRKMFGMKSAFCGPKLRETYPPPLYEDQWLVVYTIPDETQGQSNAER